MVVLSWSTITKTGKRRKLNQLIVITLDKSHNSAEYKFLNIESNSVLESKDTEKRFFLWNIKLKWMFTMK